MHSRDKRCWRQVRNAMQTLNISNVPACKGTDRSCSHPSELLHPEQPVCSLGHLRHACQSILARCHGRELLEPLGPCTRTRDPLPCEGTSPCPAPSREGAACSVPWCLCPDRPWCLCGWLEGLGAVGAWARPVLGTLPCVELLCLADSWWIEHL